MFVKFLFLAGSPANPPGCADAEPQVNTCVLENVLTTFTFIVHISSSRKETKIPTRISMQKLRGAPHLQLSKEVCWRDIGITQPDSNHAFYLLADKCCVL